MPRLARLTFVVLLALACVSFACGGQGAEPASDSNDGVIVATATLQPAGGGGGATAPEPAPTSPPGQPGTMPPRPTSGRWIDVDLTRYVVQLMDGSNVLRTIGPVAVGEQINTGEYESSQTGLFHVYIKNEVLAFNAPYNTYISHWVGFDAEKDNGFHSLLKDASGKVVDPSTGRVSNGCIRSGEAEAIFAFAEIGMPVYVHL
jgi:hypothetical protein